MLIKLLVLSFVLTCRVHGDTIRAEVVLLSAVCAVFHATQHSFINTL
jgi:hypothetical protein